MAEELNRELNEERRRREEEEREREHNLAKEREGPKEEMKKLKEQPDVAAVQVMIAKDLLIEKDKKISGLQADLQMAKLRKQAGKGKGSEADKEGDLSQDKESSIVRPPPIQTPLVKQAPVGIIKPKPMAGQYPLIIDQGRVRYVPWQNQFLEGLVKDLPSIHEGAAKWIRELKDKTQGKRLAIGDQKEVLARTWGKERQLGCFKRP